LKLGDRGLAKYRAYILYGKNIENILQRIIAFVDGCKNIIADVDLEKPFSSLCPEKPVFTEFKSYADVDKAVEASDEGKALVFFVESPREDVYAVALIPIDSFNKSAVSSGV